MQLLSATADALAVEPLDVIAVAVVAVAVAASSQKSQIFCKELVMGADNLRPIIKEAIIMPGIFSLQWHITNRCDQRCQHCYIFNSGKPLPKVEWNVSDANVVLNDFVSFCQKYNRRPNIAITGGDPLLNPNFWEIVEAISKRNIPFVILGNPFHVDESTIKKLLRYGCYSYQMSLDGLKKTHDMLRMPGSFDATIRSLQDIKKWGMKSVVMTTISKANWKELPALTRLVAKIGVDIHAFARYCPTHNDIENNLSPQEYHQLLEEMWGIYQELIETGAKTQFNFKDHLWTVLLYEKGILEIENDDVVYEGCHCGISHLTFLEDGTVYACRRMESPVGKVPEQSIEQIFFSKGMEKYRLIDKITNCKDCKLKNYCRGCRAVAAGTSGGDYFAPDPQCWFNN